MSYAYQPRFFGAMPPQPPSFRPRRSPPKRKSGPKKTTTKPKQPKPLSDQAKTTMARETVVKINSVPLPAMAKPVKDKCRVHSSKSKTGEVLPDVRGRLTQAELNAIYFQIVTAFNGGLGDLVVRNGKTESDVRLVCRVNLAPGGQIAGKLFKSYLAGVVSGTAPSKLPLDDDE